MMKYYRPKYEPPLFAELTTGDRRNCQGSAIRNRLEKIIQQFNNDHETPIVAPPGNGDPLQEEEEEGDSDNDSESS
jgi:hypothetical protein